MFWRKKTTPVAPEQWKEVSEAMFRATQEIAAVQARAPQVENLLCEYKKADPFGAQLYEAMKGKQQ